MTHYNVVVFDKMENVENLIAPYNEWVKVPWRFDGVCNSDDIELFVKNFPEDSHLPLQEMYEKHRERWHGNSTEWRFRKDKNGNDIVEKWTTYNPKSKYDYYSIIGDDELPDFVPFAFVTPDGEWHAKGEIGWWGMSWDEIPDDEWERIYSDAVDKYKNFTLLDCHI